MSLDKYSTQRVQNRIMTAMEQLVNLKRLSEELVSEAVRKSPDDEFYEDRVASTVSSLDKVLEEYDQTTVAIHNSIVVLARSITGETTDENGETEVDVIPDANGVKF